MKFKNLFYAFVFLLLMSAYAWINAQDKKFQARVELVNVDLTVTTKDGGVVNEGLSVDDFEVYEDKVKQEITNFYPREEPITTVLLIDYSKQSVFLSAYSQEEVWYGPIEFVKSLQDEDWAAILMYDLKVYNEKFHQEAGVFQDFTQNKQKLEKTLMNIFRAPPAWRESCLVDAIKTVLDMIADNREDLNKKISIVLISTGLDTFSKNLYDKILKEAQNSGVVIYAIGIGGQLRAIYEDRMSTDDRMEFLVSDSRLKSFAELTGGKVFLPKFMGELPSIFEEISIRLRNQYSLGYISSNTARDGKFRKIEIKVTKTAPDKKGKPQKLSVNHRKGYYAPKD